MPLRDYKCPSGHVEVDLLEPADAPTIHRCPKCGAESERIPSYPAGIKFVQCINRIPI